MTFEPIGGVIKILDKEGDSRGAGFIVSEKGIIISAKHVIENLGVLDSREILIEFMDESKGLVTIISKLDKNSDIIFLCLKGELPSFAQPLKMGYSIGTKGHEISAVGYPENGTKRGMLAEGRIQTHVRNNGIDLLQISSMQVQEGFSGSPVLDSITGKVVGMITDIYVPKNKRSGVTCYAISSEFIRMFGLGKIEVPFKLDLSEIRNRIDYDIKLNNWRSISKCLKLIGSEKYNYLFTKSGSTLSFFVNLDYIYNNYTKIECNLLLILLNIIYLKWQYLESDLDHVRKEEAVILINNIMKISFYVLYRSGQKSSFVLELLRNCYRFNCKMKSYDQIFRNILIECNDMLKEIIDEWIDVITSEKRHSNKSLYMRSKFRKDLINMQFIMQCILETGCPQYYRKLEKTYYRIDTLVNSVERLYMANLNSEELAERSIAKEVLCITSALRRSIENINKEIDDVERFGI